MRSVLLILTLLLPLAAQADEYLCPDKLDVVESVKNVPDGYSLNQKKWVHSIKQVAIYQGKPSDENGQLPSDESLKLSQHISRSGLHWSLKRESSISTTDYTSTPEYWMECSYKFSTLTISKPLDQKEKYCSEIMANYGSSNEAQASVGLKCNSD